jgi:hypothetical protein
LDVDRKKAYFWLMGACIVLIVLAWNVVRFYSVPAAVGMSIVAALLPPTAAIVANWGRENQGPPDSSPGPYDR